MRTSILLVSVLLLVSVGAVHAETYAIDPSHSVVAFSVRHLMISTVRGSFSDFSGSFTYVKDRPDAWRVTAEIMTASVNTNDGKRDEHLRTADFFDVANHPTMAFESTRVETAGNGYKLHGELTMLGVTRPVALDLEIQGEATDPWGNARVAFSARGKLDRRQWGMVWSQALDTGGLLVGNEVAIELEIQGIKAD